MIVNTAATTTRRRPNPIVRLFSSVYFGVGLMAAILVYASVMSALPQVRGAIEMTEMEVFRHWVFGLMIGLFVVTLVVATLRRIRFNVINLGVLTVHTGLLVLAAGCIWYFWSKVEGDVLLLSPRIELLASGRPVRGAQMLPEAGQTWDGTMPALGGTVKMAVVRSDASRAQPASAATVRVQVGTQDPVDVELVSGAVRPVSDKLSVRFTPPPPQRYFYDDETTAIAYRKLGPRDDEPRRFAEIHGLPLHRERYLDEGYTLRDTQGREVPSKRTAPAVSWGPLAIPTGWFEHWRLPVRVDAPELPFDVEVTGYLPYVSGMETVAAGGGGKENPAIDVSLSDGRSSLRESLFASSPTGSIIDTAAPVEFRWAQSGAEREAIAAPLVGPHELTIEVLDPPARQTVAIAEGQQIAVEGTPYVLTIKQLSPNWPMMSPGFEGASSPMASVDVTNGEKSYNRTVIQRFPQLSQDIDETGKRHREGPYDSNLMLRYRTSASGWVTIVAGPDAGPEVVVFEPSGAATRTALTVGKPAHLSLRGVAVHLTLNGLWRDGREITRPVIEPLDTRRPNLGRSAAAVRLKLAGRGEHSGWSDSRWVMFSMYPDTDARPLQVRLPGSVDTWELVFTRAQRELGATLHPGKLSVNFFPGRTNVESWRSDFFVQQPGSKELRPAAVYTNQTASIGRWTLFQSGASTDHWSYTILGVGNRNGITLMNVGWIMVTIGCLYAFYVKPLLLARRKRARQAAGHGDGGAPPGRAGNHRRRSPELAEMGS
ncbi:MAG: hypothetical protein HRF50_01305 [Phycisphaerae bacterium]|jgi:hypothetical protein